MNDHDRVFHQTTSLPRRPDIDWPGHCRVAFSIVVSAEYYELQPPEGSFVPPNLPGGFGRAPYPDVRAFSQREYGNRVGIFRVMDALDLQQMRATIALDANVARRYPYLVEQFLRRDFEIAAHGLSLTRVISNQMTETEERDYIRETLDTIETIAGVRPLGWHGPEYGESERTPALLAAAGVQYVLDWPNDEQPYMMQTPTGAIVSVPMALELDDVIANHHRRIGIARWLDAVNDALDQLLSDAATRGRHLVLNLHPWLIGQPHRIAYFEDLLASIRAREGLWITTAGEIAAHYRQATA